MNETILSGDFGFLAPGWLWLLGAVPVLGVLFWIVEGRRHAAMVRLGMALSAWKGKRIAGPLAIATLVIVSLSRPYFGYQEVRLRTAGRDIMAVLDISASMQAEDVAPNRLEFAKRKLLDLLTLLEREREFNRFGLVLFSGDAYVFCPVTEDFTVATSFVRSVVTDLLSSEGSDITNAINTAVAGLQESGSREGIVLLLSDGEDYSLLEDSANSYVPPTQVQESRRKLQRLLKELSVPVHLLGIGTEAGRPIPAGQGRFVNDRQGNIVVSRMRPEILEFVAETSEGRFLPATLGDRDLYELLRMTPASLDGSESEEGGTEKILRAYNEVGPYLIMAALALTLIACAAGQRGLIFGVAGACWLLAAAAPAHAQEESEPRAEQGEQISLYEAYQAYQRSDFEKAALGFEQALDRNGNDPDVVHALASSLYRLREYERARQLYDLAAKATESGREQYRSLFNRGNAEFMKQEYAAAIESYEEALLRKPADEAATFNLELAKERLQQQQQQQQQQQESDGEDQSEEQRGEQKPESQEENRDEGDQRPNQQEQQDPQREDGGSGEPNEQEQEQEQSSGSSTNEGSDESPENRSEEPGASAGSQEPEETADAREESNGDGADQEPPSGEERESRGSGQGKPGEENPRYDAKALEASEARSWLESLPDAPVLLERKHGSRATNGVTW